MEKTKVLFITQEITPYLPETKMSNVCRHLPQGIQEIGKEIRTFMPRFGNINERRNQLHEVIRLSGMNLIINDTDHSLIIKVASIQAARMQVYFIDNEDYFQRKYALRDADDVFAPDNDERAIFFARGVLETVVKLRWTPDIIHCHGWFSSLVPLYLKRAFNENPLFVNSKIIYSIYDENFTPSLNEDYSTKLQFGNVTDEDTEILKDPSFVNVTKQAINFADAIIIGSENINPEIEEYLKTIDKPILQYQDDEETYVKAYSDFYDKIKSEIIVESV